MILRICVVIPTYNNGRTISEVVRDVVTTTAFPILVVDDGSENPVSLYSWEARAAQESGRVRVVRFEQNKGKGAAIRYAIKDLSERGFTHMLTMDGDGQHFAREISHLTSLAEQHPWDLIIGARRLKSASVPEISRFGRKFSNFWVNYETGLHVRDSQSGFRLYPLLAVQTLRFFTSRYDFEIEVLIALLWKGISVREVDIDVYYPVSGERVSHFNKLWDNVRLSVLNTILVTVSLFKTHRKPGELAVAVGAGVFIGCTPFFGFHSLMVVAVALLLRLNFVVMFIGSHVSTPILAPFIVMAEMWVGDHWLHVHPEGGMKGDFYQWLAGSVVFGLLLAVLLMSVTYVAAWWVQSRKAGGNWTGETRGGRFGNGFLKLVLRYLGLRAGYFCLYFIVPYFYFFAPRGRRGISEYWRLMRPEEKFLERQKQICRHFFKFGQILMDRVYQGFKKEKQFSVALAGIENVTEALTEKRGLIMLSAHVGAWDLAAALFSERGLAEIQLVEFQAQGLSFQKIKDKMDLRQVATVDSAKRGDAIFEIHSALSKGQTLGVMGDRPLTDRFELVPFLNRIAPFDTTAFRLAAASQVPLLFTFGFKTSSGYELVAGPARIYKFADGLSKDEQCYAWSVEYVRELEKQLRRYPDQWFNFYPFWSTRPL